jgi:hypothetical protein
MPLWAISTPCLSDQVPRPATLSRSAASVGAGLLDANWHNSMSPPRHVSAPCHKRRANPSRSRACRVHTVADHPTSQITASMSDSEGARPSEATITNKLRDIVIAIHKSGKTDDLTVKRVRARAEHELGLDEGFFKTDASWKQKSQKAIVDAVVGSSNGHDIPLSKTKRRTSSVVMSPPRSPPRRRQHPSPKRSPPKPLVV